MNAQLKPVEKTLFQEQLEAVRWYGAPGAHLEAPEVPRWTQELDPLNDMTGQLTDALSDSDDKPRDRLSKLLEQCMGDITADQLIELRDSLRSIVLDYSIGQMQRMIERELEVDP